jgi:hypothetical protein
MTAFPSLGRPAIARDSVGADLPLIPTPTVAAQINQAHADAQAYASKAVERALVAGDLLNQVKAELRHGEFGAWCKQHCPAISTRTIQDYMRVARELPVEIRSAAYLSLREALRLVADPEPEPEPEPATGELLPAAAATPDPADLAKPDPVGMCALPQELAKVLQEGAAMRADIKENSRRAKERNAKDPRYMNAMAWSRLISDVKSCKKSMVAMLKKGAPLTCPPRELDNLLKDLEALSAFAERYGRGQNTEGTA